MSSCFGNVLLIDVVHDAFYSYKGVGESVLHAADHVHVQVHIVQWQCPQCLAFK